MSLLIIPALIISVSYFGLILLYLRNWQALTYWTLNKDYTPNTTIDVIIPARNEAGSISSCLQSVLDNTYPKSLYKVWVVDDFSTDHTAEIVRQWQEKYPNVALLQMSNFPLRAEEVAFKKKAIACGIEQSSASLIVTTDADCMVPSDWLLNWAAFFDQREVVMATAPIELVGEETALGRFQALDTLGMMLITGAGIKGGWMRMGNGANLAYLRTAFQEIGGFIGIDDLASGDDMLLLQKMAKAFPGQIGFVKSKTMVVRTGVQPDYSSFLSQRLRWASKSSRYPEKRVTLALAVVFAYCWALILSLCLIAIQPVIGVALFLLLFLLKSGIDFYFLQRAANFFGRKSLLQRYWLSQIHHIVYIAVVGLLANFRKTYVWKGRRVY